MYHANIVEDCVDERDGASPSRLGSFIEKSFHIFVLTCRIKMKRKLKMNWLAHPCIEAFRGANERS